MALIEMGSVEESILALVVSDVVLFVKLIVCVVSGCS